MVRSSSLHNYPSPNYAQLCAKMGTRALKNGQSSIFTMDSNSVTSKTPLATIPSKSAEFDKMAKKRPYSSKGIFALFGRLQNQKCPIL